MARDYGLIGNWLASKACRDSPRKAQEKQKQKQKQKKTKQKIENENVENWKSASLQNVSPLPKWTKDKRAILRREIQSTTTMTDLTVWIIQAINPRQQQIELLTKSRSESVGVLWMKRSKRTRFEEQLTRED